MNSIVRTNLVTIEPILLAQMKNWLRVYVTSDDTEIADLISEARQHCELLSNCALVRSTFVQYLDHFPGSHAREYDSFGGGRSASGHDGFGLDRNHHWHGEIKMKRPPLISVQPIWYISTDGRPYTLNPGQDFIVDVASTPGRIRPIPYTVWPLTLHVPAAIAIPFTAGYAPNSDGIAAGQTAISEPESQTSALNQTWQPSQTVLQYAFQVDENNNIWIQTTSPSGVTGSGVRPGFEAIAIGSPLTGDGTANWLNVGPLRGFWTPGTVYAGLKQCVVLDFNSNLQLLNVASLISQTIPPYSLQAVGASPLPWSTILGGFTKDNGVTSAWLCIGPYIALGDNGLALPNSPEQQAAFIVDRTLPKTASRAMRYLVTHWYRNRELVTSGAANKVPIGFEDLLGSVTIEDFSPTP